MYETKVILALISQVVGKSNSVEEAYNAVVAAANHDGMALPNYKEFLKQNAKYREETK